MRQRSNVLDMEERVLINPSHTHRWLRVMLNLLAVPFGLLAMLFGGLWIWLVAQRVFSLPDTALSAT